MKKTFNTTGPCRAERHYMLAAEGRLPDMMRFVKEELYFVIHAPRQTGKTTAMLAFAERLRGMGMVAVWVTLERSQGLREIGEAEPTWLDAIRNAGKVLPTEWQLPAEFPQTPVGTQFGNYLTEWCEAVKKPIVLLVDETDVVEGPAMVSLLRQLRAGFTTRGVGKFPVSVALIGMRDLRDYLTTAKDGRPVNSGSPFNIKSKSITLRNFTEAEVGALYQQHTDATGQVFLPEAVARVFYWTQGQPFLVNALADRCVSELATDGSAITAERIDTAKEQLIRDRTTHLHNLGERLKEERVAKIMAAVLLGKESYTVDQSSDDLTYCEDLGLVRIEPKIEAANPLYREVLVRTLAQARQPDVPERSWVKAGKLDVVALVDSFFVWWRRNADALREQDTTPYREAVPQIVFMAWVQKVVNGGGRVTREYALGRGRVDMMVEMAGERHIFEMKRVRARDSLETIKEEGVEQMMGYMEIVGEKEGWLLIFDERERSWTEKIWREEVEVDGKVLHVRGG